jgi:phenylacetaldehyde dehydrogenase
MTDLSALTAPAHSAAAAAFLSRAPHGHLIGGTWQPATETFDTVDPATGKVLAAVARGDAATVDKAVSAARTALETGTWPAMTPMDRAKLLWAIADKLEAHIDELAELETLDQGKPLYVGRWAEIPGAIAQFRFFGGLANQIEGKSIPTSVNYQPPGKEVFAYTVKEPVGVVDQPPLSGPR